MATTTQTQTNPKNADFTTITAPIKPHLDAFARCLSEQKDQFEPEIREHIGYCLAHKGKHLRPILVYKAGWQGDDHAPDQALTQAAAVVELVHLATLVHDDILDDATLRHGTPTATEKYGAHAAVLIGDALFSHALNLASQFPTVEVCRLVSQATRRVVAGEISQTFDRNNPDIALEAYYRIIDLKTAELFSVSCRLGALLSVQPDSFIEDTARFGRHLGIAYQIYDDLSDFYGSEKKIGKTLGTDLESGKYTLPLLLLLQQLDEPQRKELYAQIDKKTLGADDLLPLMDKHSIRTQVAAHFKREVASARESLTEHKDNAATEQLLLLANFVDAQISKLSK